MSLPFQNMPQLLTIILGTIIINMITTIFGYILIKEIYRSREEEKCASEKKGDGSNYLEWDGFGYCGADTDYYFEDSEK
jgi:hypothetical protein